MNTQFLITSCDIYGEQRNDELKMHPCLLPYEELPEEEKEYDRNTSVETLRLWY